MGEFPKYKAAATQVAPEFLDIHRSVDKACDVIEEAARHGAKLVGFPEGFLTGYPQWIFMGKSFGENVEFYKRLYRNAITIPGPETLKIAKCARENEIFVCMSCTELDNASLYLTQVWFDDKGNIMGKHRKIRPTNGERAIWGEGDGSMMPVFNTKIGNLGGLMCWEHRMPANLMIMKSKNEQVHVAGWPAGSDDDDHIFSSRANVDASKYYAQTTGTYIVMCSSPLTEPMRKILIDNDPIMEERVQKGCGHAGILSLSGKHMVDPIPHDEEGILYAEIDLSLAIDAHYLLDCAGHYGKASVGKLIYNQESQDAVQYIGKGKNYAVSFEKMKEYIEKGE